MTPETLADLLAARIPLAIGVPVVEAGESGMKGARGIVVPAASRPGEFAVLWLDKVPGMQTGITHGTVVDPRERAGFLWLCDEAERRGCRLDLGAARSLEWWEGPDAPCLEPRRPRMIAALSHALRDSTPARYTVEPTAGGYHVTDRETGAFVTDVGVSRWMERAGAEAVAARLNVGVARG
jgi:hypothetical protein